MKKLLLVAGFAALAACGQKQEPAASEDTNATVAEADANAADANAAGMVTANGSLPGTYEVTMKDGSKGQSTLNPDGTYVDKDSDGSESKGTWNVAGGKTCFDPEGDEGPTCYTETSTAADGSFTATPDKGDPVTVKKIG
jgi:hypothetical protein